MHILSGPGNRAWQGEGGGECTSFQQSDRWWPTTVRAKSRGKKKKIHGKKESLATRDTSPPRGVN